MLGAILGDIGGSQFEYNNIKTKEFELFNDQCFYTDDTVMTLAIGQALCYCEETEANTKQQAYAHLSDSAVGCMQRWGRKYPNAGYGGMFSRWLWEEDPKPYNSFGNGAAMRVSACGFAATSMEEALDFAERVTAVSHNHPEAIRGAKATVAAIILARAGCSKEYIREHIEKHYYTLDFTLDQIRDSYQYDVRCQGKVPQALVAFFESTDFEDAIRNAISIGGDSDTIAAITGGIAEAFYGVPYPLQRKVVKYLPPDLLGVLREFQEMFQRNDWNAWIRRQYGNNESSFFRDYLKNGKNDFFNTGKYKMIPELVQDEFDIHKYCESLWVTAEPIEFSPLFKNDFDGLDEILSRFLCGWSIIKTDDYQCVGMVSFEKIRNDESLVSFEMTIQPDEEWEDIFPSMIKFVFEQYNANKIIAPRTNIPPQIKEVFERIGMKNESETYEYRTSWGYIPVEICSFHRKDFIIQ